MCTDLRSRGVVMLAVLLVAVGGFTAWRVADRPAEPSPGDQYDVTFTCRRRV